MPPDVANAPPDLPVTRRNIAPAAPDGTPPADAPAWISEIDHPYLHGPFAPVATELDARDLPVQGELPRDLSGLYAINSPNQRFKPAFRYHYYDGDGMVHGLWFENGRARYARRWVRTFAFEAETAAGRNLWPGLAGPYDFSLPHSPIKDNSNTDVIFYAGKLLTLWYMAGVPYAVDPLTLETRGAEDFGGGLKHTLSAHSKVDPATGELLFFTYGDRPPYMVYGVADASGRLIHETAIDLPGPRSPHDLGVTENYAILHDLPLFHDAELLHRHKRRVLKFHRDVPSRFGIVPRRGGRGDVRWFEAAPCYILHLLNCWEDGDWIVMDGCRQPEPVNPVDPADGALGAQLSYRRRVHELYRWRLNLKTGETREGRLDDANTEFPRINPNRLGRRSRFSYNQLLPLPNGPGLSGRMQTFDALVKHDTETGRSWRYEYGAGVSGNELPFAPRDGAGPDAAEDDGYVVTVATDAKDWRSEALVFDARAIEKGPLARVALPSRVPVGFHTAWVPGAAIFKV